MHRALVLAAAVSLGLIAPKARAADSLDMVRAGSTLKSETAKARPPNCANPASLRAFKNVVMGRLVGTLAPGKKTAGDWARCLCGKAADDAGFGDPPPNPNSVPASLACSHGMPREKCAERDASAYFKAHLALTDEQALRLGRCSWGLDPDAAGAQPAPATSTATVTRKDAAPGSAP